MGGGQVLQIRAQDVGDTSSVDTRYLKSRRAVRSRVGRSREGLKIRAQDIGGGMWSNVYKRTPNIF